MLWCAALTNGPNRSHALGLLRFRNSTNRVGGHDLVALVKPFPRRTRLERARRQDDETRRQGYRDELPPEELGQIVHRSRFGHKFGPCPSPVRFSSFKGGMFFLVID